MPLVLKGKDATSSNENGIGDIDKGKDYDMKPSGRRLLCSMG